MDVRQYFEKQYTVEHFIFPALFSPGPCCAISRLVVYSRTPAWFYTVKQRAY
jgi:hypothetical protein